MGEEPEVAGSLEERWGMRRRTLMKSLLSQEMWKVTSCPGGHLRINRKKRISAFVRLNLLFITYLQGHYYDLLSL